MSTDAVFAADPEGWREQNAGRPAAHLIRELVQNVFDEKATALDLGLSYDAKTGVSYVVVDNVPGGIRDPRMIFTLFASDKADEPTKRGRMGRGLKELISVSEHVLITTANAPAMEFERGRGGKWSRTAPIKKRPEAGTVITGNCRLWKKADLDAIVIYLRRMQPPAGLTFTVNGEAVGRRAPVESYEMGLTTVVFEQTEAGRISRERRGETTVEMLSEPESWVYEMGVPVEKIDFPMSIDVGQRIPLREKRDTLTDPFRRELYAKLLDARVGAGLVSDAELRDSHVLIAAQDAWNLSTSTKQRIAHVWTEGKPYAPTPADVSTATGMHIPVVNLRSLPEAVRALAKDVGQNVRDIIAQVNRVSCDTVQHSDQTVDQRRLIACWEWLAEKIGRPTQVVLKLGKVSYVAAYSRLPGDRGLLTVYLDQFGTAVEEPFGTAALSTFIHELSHWTSHGDEHGSGFTNDSEDVGAVVAAVMFKHNNDACLVRWGMEPSTDDKH